jgi:hypothetical protein
MVIDEFHVPRDGLFRELVRLLNGIVRSNRPRRNRIEAIKADFGKRLVQDC